MGCKHVQDFGSRQQAFRCMGEQQLQDKSAVISWLLDLVHEECMAALL